MAIKLKRNIELYKQEKATATQKKIVKMLNLKKWTVTCERLEDFVNEYGLTLNRIIFRESTDSLYTQRKPRKHLRSVELRSTGRISNWGVNKLYAFCNGNCGRCRSKIKCQLLTSEE